MIPVTFWIVADPPVFYSAVFLTPSILFSILDFISHSNFEILQHPGWEVPNIGWL